MRRALKNWLEISPLTNTSLPASPLASMVTGGQPESRSDVATAPSRLSATSKSEIGPLPHSWGAVKVEGSDSRGQHRRQKTEARSGIRQVERGRLATG